MRSRLCAMIFSDQQTGQQAERNGPADLGVRATPEVLVDLLVEDLATDRNELLQRVPPLLDGLVAGGDLMKVGRNTRCNARGAGMER